MNQIKLAKGVYYVGCKDWKLRDFHGFTTVRGVTYNAYLIVDEKICLVDLVKNTFADELLARISSILPPEKIDYIVMNHVENDQASALPQVMEKAAGAKIFITAAGAKEAARLYGQYDYNIVKEGDKLELGENSLHFVTLPMLHWPDSMVAYMPGEKILFSNDAFGQHICASSPFDDGSDLAAVMEEAQNYYANILMPYSKLIGGALGKAGGLAIETIAPSHGVIWRSHIKDILEKYAFWGQGGVKDKVLVVYDSMWGATERMAKAIWEGAAKTGVDARLYKPGPAENSRIVAELLDAAGALFGSPTLNYGMMPSIGGLLLYLKGLKPAGKLAASFGTYGWSGGAQKDMDELLQKAGMSLEPALTLNWAPSAEDLSNCENFGFNFANKACPPKH
ncbi:MAG: FprA family A-type flavoprotein [Acidaminococcales bacterium]|jgi:flavorubredoxin|nr:FprA family A-type flavoprotein [Acidaminococcales bacterium]